MTGPVQTVRAAELRPGDVFATLNGRPVLDTVSSGYPPIGYIGLWPHPVKDVPLTVTIVREFEHNGRHMVYVEASNGHGGSETWPGLKAHIMPRESAS